MPNFPQDPISVAEAARMLRADVRTVHRMILRGDLHGVKAFGGLRAPYLIARAEVEALVRSRIERLGGVSISA